MKTEAKTLPGMDYTLVTKDTTELGSGWFVAAGDVTIDGTVTVNGTGAEPTNLILMDGAKLTVTGSDDSAGINVATEEEGTVHAL
ncbi:MAG: hypothetical protein MJ099_04100, partial [Clostridia bacterium]|nr:hypothetical protein [Clostridia bacterium]